MKIETILKIIDMAALALAIVLFYFAGALWWTIGLILIPYGIWCGVNARINQDLERKPGDIQYNWESNVDSAKWFSERIRKISKDK